MIKIKEFKSLVHKSPGNGIQSFSKSISNIGFNESDFFRLWCVVRHKQIIMIMVKEIGIYDRANSAI